MAVRSALAGVVLLLTTLAAAAQGVPRQYAVPDCLDQPTQYPSLLRPPAGPDPPLAVVPRGPSGEYDHGHVYLPEYVPPPGPEACRPLGRWWISPSFEFAWMPSRPITGAVFLGAPTPGLGAVPAAVIPFNGVSTETFQGGFGLTGGFWCNRDNTRGIDAGFFTLGGAETTVYGFAPDMVIMLNGAGSRPQVLVFPPPSLLLGVFPATMSTWYITTDVNYRHNLHCGPCARLDLLAGYRFAYLEDELFLGDSRDGSHDDYRDNRLAVANPFHGGQIGVAGEYRGERWYVAGTAKVALGAVSPYVCTTGFFQSAEAATNRGLTPLRTLLDSTRSEFAVLPMLNLQVGRQIGNHARIYAGYTFQYLNRAARLADVLDPAATSLNLTDFWVQSLGLGFELRY
jgi:putative beta barrel porin BBP7